MFFRMTITVVVVVMMMMMMHRVLCPSDLQSDPGARWMGVVPCTLREATSGNRVARRVVAGRGGAYARATNENENGKRTSGQAQSACAGAEREPASYSFSIPAWN